MHVLLVFLACFSGAMAFQCITCNNRPQDDDTQRCVERTEECPMGVNSCSSVLYTEQNGKVHERKFCTSPGSALFRYLLFFPGGAVCQNINMQNIARPEEFDARRFAEQSQVVDLDALLSRKQDRPVVRLVVDPLTNERRQLRNREPLIRVFVDPITQQRVEVVDREQQVQEVVSPSGMRHQVVAGEPVVRQIVDPMTGEVRLLEDFEPIVRVVKDKNAQNEQQRFAIDRQPALPFIVDPITKMRLRLVRTQPQIGEVVDPVQTGEKVVLRQVVHPTLPLRMMVIVKRVVDVLTKQHRLVLDVNNNINRIRLQNTNKLFLVEDGVVVGVSHVNRPMTVPDPSFKDITQVVDEQNQILLQIVGERTFIWETTDLTSGQHVEVEVREVLHPTQRSHILVVVEKVQDPTTQTIRLRLSSKPINVVRDPVLRQQFRVVDSVVQTQSDVKEDQSELIMNRFQSPNQMWNEKRIRQRSILNKMDMDLNAPFQQGNQFNVPLEIQQGSEDEERTTEDRMVNNVILDRVSGIRHLNQWNRHPVKFNVVGPINAKESQVLVMEVFDPAVQTRRLVVVKPVQDTLTKGRRLVINNDQKVPFTAVKDPITGISFNVKNGALVGTEQFMQDFVPNMKARQVIVPAVQQNERVFPQVVAIDRFDVTDLKRNTNLDWNNQISQNLDQDRDSVLFPEETEKMPWTGSFPMDQSRRAYSTYSPAPPQDFDVQVLCVCSEERCNQGSTKNVVQRNLLQNVQSMNKVRGPFMKAVLGKTIIQ